MSYGGNTNNSKPQRLTGSDKRLILLEQRIEGVSEKPETQCKKRIVCIRVHQIS